MKGKETMRYTLRPKDKRRPNEQLRPMCGKHTKLWRVNHVTLKIIETECTDIWIPARSGHFVYTLSTTFGGGHSCFSRAFGKYFSVSFLVSSDYSFIYFFIASSIRFPIITT